MTDDEKALFLLHPHSMMSKWAKEGTLCRNMKVFDTENTYIPTNIFETGHHKISHLLTMICYKEDELGRCYWKDFQPWKTYSVTRKWIREAVKQNILKIVFENDHYIVFDYSKFAKFEENT